MIRISSLMMSLVVLAGCGLGGDAGVSEAASNQQSAVGSAVSENAAADQLMGYWVATDSATLLAVKFERTWAAKAFTGEQKTLCVMDPCYPLHIKGSWTVKNGVLTLDQNGTKDSYEYVVTEESLSLFSTISHQSVGHLLRSQGSCKSNSDCTKNGYTCQPDPTAASTGSGLSSCQPVPTCETNIDCKDGLRCLPDPTDPCNNPGPNTSCTLPGRNICQ